MKQKNCKKCGCVLFGAREEKTGLCSDCANRNAEVKWRCRWCGVALSPQETREGLCYDCADYLMSQDFLECYKGICERNGVPAI
jgi:hypothetical protein